MTVELVLYQFVEALQPPPDFFDKITIQFTFYPNSGSWVVSTSILDTCHEGARIRSRVL